VHKDSAAKGCPDKLLCIPVYTEVNKLHLLCIANYKTGGMKRTGLRIWIMFPDWVWIQYLEIRQCISRANLLRCSLLIILIYKQSSRLLACCDWGFESRRGHGSLSLVSVMCCQVEFSAFGWSLVHKSPTECGVSECDREVSQGEAMIPSRVEAPQYGVF
jgi:hypothetical protein